MAGSFPRDPTSILTLDAGSRPVYYLLGSGGAIVTGRLLVYQDRCFPVPVNTIPVEVTDEMLTRNEEIRFTGTGDATINLPDLCLTARSSRVYVHNNARVNITVNGGAQTSVNFESSKVTNALYFIIKNDRLDNDSTVVNFTIITNI